MFLSYYVGERALLSAFETAKIELKKKMVTCTLYKYNAWTKKAVILFSWLLNGKGDISDQCERIFFLTNYCNTYRTYSATSRSRL